MRDPPRNQTAEGAGFYLRPSPGLGRGNSWEWRRSGLRRKGLHRRSAPPARPLCTDTGRGWALCSLQRDRLLGGQKSKRPPCCPGLAITSTSERRAVRETKESLPQINHQSYTNHLCVPSKAQNPPAFHWDTHWNEMVITLFISAEYFGYPLSLEA